MKANVKIILITALIAGACSSGVHLSSGYDDLYYTPGDEPVTVAVVERTETPAVRETREVTPVVRQPEQRYAYEEYNVSPYDTIWFDEYFVVGRDTFAYEQLYYDERQLADGRPANITNYNYYGNGDYYWSTRLRRFHSDYYYYGGYYDPFYTDFYWRSMNRYYFGMSWAWGYPYYSPWRSSLYFGYNSPWYSPWYSSWYSPWYSSWYSPYYSRMYYYPHTYWGHYGYYGYHTPIYGRRVAYHTGHRRGSGSYIGGGMGGYTPTSGVTDAYGRRTATTAAPGTRRTGDPGTSPAGTVARPEGTTTRTAGTTVRPEGTATRPAGTTTRPEGTTTRPAGTTTRPAGTTTRPEGTTTRPAGTTTRPQGTTTRPAGTTTRPAGTTTRPAGTTTRPAGTTTRPAGTTTSPAGTTRSRDEAGTETRQVTTPTYTRPAPGDRSTYNRSTGNYQIRSVPAEGSSSSGSSSGGSTYTRPTSSATYNRPDSRSGSTTTTTGVRTATPTRSTPSTRTATPTRSTPSVRSTPSGTSRPASTGTPARTSSGGSSSGGSRSAPAGGGTRR